MLMTLRKKNNQKGFTLIELLIVIAIIGILAAIAIPQFAEYRKRGYMSQVRSDVKNTFTAVNLWATDNPAGTPPAETVTGPAAFVNYEARLSENVTVAVAAGGDVTGTHPELTGSYLMDYPTGAITDTLS